MPFNMSVFTGKPRGYKGGVILLVIGTLLYIIAFSAPFWVKSGPEEEEEEKYYVRQLYTGLWQQCVYSLRGSVVCLSAHPLLFSDYFQSGAIAIQALQCVGLVGLILATWNEVQTNFFDGGLPCRYFTEVTGGLGSLTGFTGAMVFVYGMLKVLPTGWFEYSWCLPLDIAGCLSCALSTFLTSKFKGYDDTTYSATQPLSLLSPLSHSVHSAYSVHPAFSATQPLSLLSPPSLLSHSVNPAYLATQPLSPPSLLSHSAYSVHPAYSATQPLSLLSPPSLLIHSATQPTQSTQPTQPLSPPSLLSHSATQPTQPTQPLSLLSPAAPRDCEMIE